MLLNFATMGTTIGHEFSHAFDTNGVQLDLFNGELGWWNQETQAAYQERVDCFVRQYSAYFDQQAQLPLNGRATLNENLADQGGVVLAYFGRRMSRLLSQLSHRSQLPNQQERLPGAMARFDGDQLFFISYASVFCETHRREAIRQQIQTGVHSPGRYRVIGALSNFEQFAQSFRCPANSPMNPSTKCQLW